MRIEKAHQSHINLAKAIFLLWPTVFIAYLLIQLLNQQYVLLQDKSIQHTTFYAVGTLIGTILFLIPIRSYIYFIGWAITYWLGLKSIVFFGQSEFDIFFREVTFKVCSFTFMAGFIAAWLTFRVKWGTWLLQLILTTLSILVLYSKTFQSQIAIERWLIILFIFNLYCIVVNNAISKEIWQRKFSWQRLARTALLPLFIILALLGSTLFVLQDQFKPLTQKLIDQGDTSSNAGQQSMVQKNANGRYEMNDSLSTGKSNKRNNDLLFVAFLDHYFDDGKIPNPLYLSTYVYNRFDDSTETFVRDSTQQNWDQLYSPNLQTLDNYQIQVNDSLKKHLQSYKYTKTIQSKIYGVDIDETVIIAPFAAYSIQKLYLSNQQKKDYQFAYQTQSVISTLNSAYFVYNDQDPILQKFQEQRYDILRKFNSLSSLDTAFLQYYTRLPQNPHYGIIADLADSLAATQATIIDKVLAIKQYFTSKLPNGAPKFKYADNPGLPDLPSGSQLVDFLFKTQTGYCAHYAGATLLLLRYMGIPSRVIGGFSMVDRSNNNPGWYWVYADQAHAWVQVYFPGIGWIDFDTTVGDEESQESPQPDGTPPIIPEVPKYILQGHVASILDADSIFAGVIKHVIIDGQLKSDAQQLKQLNIKGAQISWSHNDSAKLIDSHYHFEAVIVKSSKLIAQNGIVDTLATLQVDQIQFTKQTDEVPPSKELLDNTNNSIVRLLLLLGVLIPLLILLFSSNGLYAMYLKLRAQSSRGAAQQMFWLNRHLVFKLYLLGILRNSQTPLQWAKNIDQVHNLGLVDWYKMFNEAKYAHLQKPDKAHIKQKHHSIHLKIVQQFGQSKIFKANTKWLNGWMFILNKNLK